MSDLTPRARLGVILYSGNRTVEPYFRTNAPQSLAIHVTRMRMGSGGLRSREDMFADIIAAAEMLAEAGVDVIDLQATGIMMERGPDGEREVTDAITAATGIAAYSSTQAVVAGLRALGATTLTLISQQDEAAFARESAYLAAAGFTVAAGAALGLGRALGAGELGADFWVDAARAHDVAAAQGIFLSGSNTTMADAVPAVEAALGKPAVASAQAALWAAVGRLADKLGETAPPPILGRLATVPGGSARA